MSLYHSFKDLAQDIRSTKFNAERTNSFETRAENFFRKFKKYSMGACTSRKPYLHVLREHIGKLMLFWGETINWGYGYFYCNAGEHLNKLIKQLEINSTNMDKSRYFTIMRTLRVKQFHFGESILTEKRDIRCSRCNLMGHNKKNKNCPMHPEQPEMYFSDSDGDT